MWYQIWSKPALRITTQQCYEERIYKHIIPCVGDIPLCHLTQNHLQQFYAELKRNGRLIRQDRFGPGLSDRMVRSCHATCRMALEKAQTEGLIRVNPAVGCKLPPKKAREMQVLSHEEMQRFLIQAKEDGFYEMMLLELATGMRRGEICALQWDDLNLRTGELHIQRQVIHVAGALHESSPKTKSSDRVVILPPAVLAVLRELKERTDSRWMFPSPVREDAPLDPQSVYRKMKKALVRAQCKDIRFHDLRHTFATTALEHGIGYRRAGESAYDYLMKTALMDLNELHGDVTPGVHAACAAGAWMAAVRGVAGVKMFADRILQTKFSEFYCNAKRQCPARINAGRCLFRMRSNHRFLKTARGVFSSLSLSLEPHL